MDAARRIRPLTDRTAGSQAARGSHAFLHPPAERHRSVTQDHRLLLVAGLGDADLARSFAARVGGDLDRAVTRYGEEEFVEGPLPVRVEHRTLVIDGSAELTPRAGELDVRLGEEQFSIERKRFDRVRVQGGDGVDDTLALTGTRYEASAAGDHVRIGGDMQVDVDGIERLRLAARTITVDDLSPTDVFQVDADGADAVTVNASDADDQVSVAALSGAVAVLGPTFVQVEHAEATDRLKVNGRGGDDILGASTAAMALTLDGGRGGDVVRGGPGADVLIGGAAFDDVTGGKGDDRAVLGGDNDRFNWRPGDGSDRVDGGAGRNSLSFFGTNDAEAFVLQPDGRGLRFTRDVDAVGLDLDRIEEIDPVLGGGADTFAVGDLSRTDAALVDISLGSGGPGGDGQADRVAVQGTDGHDTMTLTGKVVVAGTATLTGLRATVNISHAEGAHDTLAIDTRRGQDSVATSGLAPGTIGLEILD